VNTLQQMRLFVEPASISAIGVSRKTGPGEFNLLQNLVAYGYEGRLYPVNPHAAEILGLTAYPDVQTVPETTDLALISLPRDLVLQTVSQCIAKGIKAIVIITQGFADADDERGPLLQRDLVEMIRGTGVRILGPNTFGIANAKLKLSSSYIPVPMEVNGVGTVSQTGGTFIGLNDIRLIGKAIDVGDMCDVDIVDALDYYAEDPETRVIALHVEGMPEARTFMRALEHTARKKPVVALKTGRSERVAEAVQSHTGALTGRDEVWDVALREAGATRVADIEEMADALRAFLRLTPPAGSGVGITTYTGGFGIIAADACARSGFELVKFSDATMDELRKLSPDWLGVGNPVDIWPGVSIMGHTRKAMETAALRLVMNDPNVHAAMAVIGAFDPEMGFEYRDMISEMAREHPGKPFVYFMYGPSFREVKEAVEGTGTTLAFPTPERAFRALGHLKRRQEFLSRSR
jgi:acyl-CoA synthetase (NDP forming)